MKTRTIAVRLDEHHEQILEALCAHEHLRITDVVQRALRSYAEQLKVKPAAKSRARGKK